MLSSRFTARASLLAGTVLLSAAMANAAPQPSETTPAPVATAPPVVIPINPTISPLHPDVPQTITSPLGKTMALKFDDEFDAVPDYSDGKPYINRSKWQTTFWQGSSQRSLFANGEAQYYMDKYYRGQGKIKPEQVVNPFSFEKPGILTISATKVPKELWGNWWMGEQRPFASGLLISDAHFTFRYGYMEGRFKLPNNRGTWPAFWLLGVHPGKQTQDEQHEWPPEIDVFEFFGHRPTKFTTGYIPRKPENVKVSRWMQEPGFDITQDFHTWGFEWDENTAVWTFDGKEVARGPVSESFRRPMYILINLAVGGNWYSQEMTAAKTPYKAWEVDEASMPWKMECDYVRVYQPDSTTPTFIPAPTFVPKPAPPPATATKDGPTPYPDPKDEAAWPGQGPIRVFGWMVDNRNYFWTQREKDQGAVVFIGDSLTGNWRQMAEAFPGLKVANRGIGGDVSRGLLFRFREDVLDLKPRAVVLCIGGNDLSAHTNPADVEQNIAAMLDQIRAYSPTLPIVLCLLPPRDNPDAPTKPGALADLNARIARLGAGKENIVVLDLFTALSTPEGKPQEEFFVKDRLHLAAPGYQKWAELLRPAFERLGVK